MIETPVPAAHRRPTVRDVVRRRLVAVAVLMAAMATPLIVAGPAQAASVGYVRLAHLSPDTPKVDVYLSAFGGSNKPTVLRGVGYGALSPYQRVDAGRYTVSMRKPGAPADSPAILSTSLNVQADKVYTVAGIGPNKSVALKVLVDDVAPPSQGKARIRVVQASSAVPKVDVSTSDGLEIAKDAAFPSTTAYTEVPAKQWTLTVTPVGGSAQAVEKPLDVTAGAIYTVLVLDNSQGGLQVLVRKDMASASRTPVGAVGAGLGGAATSDGGQLTSGLLVGVAILLLVAAGLLVVRPGAWGRALGRATYR
jgi:hypothetical protein